MAMQTVATGLQLIGTVTTGFGIVFARLKVPVWTTSNAKRSALKG